MIAMRRPSLVSCLSGATAVEFAIVLPPFIMLMLGIISAGIAVFTAASMRYAVEEAARCYSVSASQCSGSATTTQTYAQNIYFGPSSPTFTASLSTTTCGNATNPGHQVNATLNVVLDVGMARWNIPMSATACFP
jgi:Flp pilus assembly protein TadG